MFEKPQNVGYTSFKKESTYGKVRINNVGRTIAG